MLSSACLLVAAILPQCDAAFDKVFGRWEHPVPSVVEDAARTLELYSRNEVMRLKDTATGREYLYMPNPGRPRMGTSEAVGLVGVDSAFFDAYGSVRLVVNDQEVELAGKGWRPVNIQSGLVCEFDECRDIGARGALTIQIEPLGAVSNVQFYREGWERLTLDDVLEQGGDTISIVGWERISQMLFRDAFLVADAVGMCAERSDAACAKIVDEAPGYAARVLETITKWPSWRTWDETGTAEGLRTWDRGNWANGYLPAAFAILTKLSGRDYPEVWRKQVLALFDSDDFPQAAHWIKRSTNHGAIIYGNLIGASLLMAGCTPDEFTHRLLKQWNRITQAAVVDGFYLESVSYSEVFFPESLFWAFVLSGCKEKPIASVLEEYYSGTLGMFAATSKAITLASGTRWLNYGDCCNSLLWTAEMAALLAPFDGFWASVPTLRPKFPNTLARLKVMPTSASMAELTFCRVYEDAGIAMVDASAARAAIRSMPLHRTHNKDVDLGAISVAVGSDVIIERELGTPREKSRSAVTQPTSWIEPADEACFGKTPDCGGRTVNGSLRGRVQTADTCVVSARGTSKNLHRVLAAKQVDDGLYITLFDVARLGDAESIHVNLPAHPALTMRSETIRLQEMSVVVTQLHVGDRACDAGAIVEVRGATARIRDCDAAPLMSVRLNDITRRP